MSIIDQINTKFGDKVEIFEKSKKRIYIAVAREDAKEVVRYIFKDLGARLSIATGIDTRAGIEILYHMAFDRHNVMVTVRTLANKPELEIRSVTDFLSGAEWIEREIHEMFGVNFIGHPNLKRLLLPDDWPEGEHPYRKKTFESEKENEER